jgi:hypothetical protein
MKVDWVEILDEPYTINGTFINPDNYFVLVQNFKSILSTRMSPTTLDVKIMGPSLSCLVSKYKTIEPYIDAFKNITDPILDAWSVHVVENEIDSNYFNDSTFSARAYVLTQLTATINFMKWTIPNIPIYVTKFGTNATRFSQGIDYGKGASETVEYGMRLIDNICGIISAGGSIAISWLLVSKYEQSDNRALYRKDGSRRPQRDALFLVSKVLPVSGTVYLCQDISNDDFDNLNDMRDQTLKAFIVSGNSFGFILSRPQPTDAHGNTITMQINNNNWNSTNLVCTMNLYVYPTYASLGAVTKEITVSNGVMTIVLQHLPFNCVIYGKGDVYVSRALLTPSIPKKMFNFPSISDKNKLENIHEGDIVYNVLNKSFEIYRNGSWEACQIYSA